MNWTLMFIALLLAQTPVPSISITVLPKHFALPVHTDRQIDSSNLRPGTAVELKISHNIRWQDCLVFREGTLVSAVVSEAHGPGVVGQSSLIVLDVQSTTATDGTVVPLSGSIRAEGQDRTMESIGITAEVCCLGIFLPGDRRTVGKGAGTLALTTAEVEVRCVH